MKLTLEEIWKMADLLEEAQKVSIKSKSVLQEKTQKPETKERVLRLPKLQISENWGKADQVDRKELERIVDTATRGQRETFDKLRIIQQQMEKLRTGQLGKIKNPRRILSQIILLETMNRLFKSFQPAPAGFINEAFLSVFYGGVQTAAGEANLAKDIGDVTDPNGIPISIKTKGSGGLIVDGSVENLYSSINRAGKVYFDIYEKIASGEGEVGKLNVFRFVVDKTNINQFLGKEYFKLENDKLVPLGKFKVGGVDYGEEIDESLIDEAKDEPYDVLAKTSFNIEDQKLDKLVKDLGPTVMSRLISKIEQDIETTKVPEIRDNMKNVIKKLSSVQIQRKRVEKNVGSLDREFKISQTQWLPFARQAGTDKITLSFSDKEINEILQRSVEELDKNIVEIFNSLDGFSQSINSYLTSIKANRGEDGMKALQYAKNLEPQTKQVLQKTTADGED